MLDYNQKTSQELAAFFSDHGLFPDGTPLSKRVLLTLYRKIAEGRPVHKQALASLLNIDELDLKIILDELPPSNIVFDKEDYIIGYRGLSQEPSDHHLMIKGIKLYAWCAFDCLFIPELLGCKIEVKSQCPETKEEIHLILSPNTIDKMCPQTIFVSFITPDLDTYQSDLRRNFCCHVNFFSSEEAGNSWTKRNEGTVLLGLEQAFALAHIRNKSGFGEAL